MSNRFAAIVMINDLITVRHYCRRMEVDKVPDVAIDYLIVNYDLIQKIFTSVTSNTTDLEREKLYKNHRELDSSVIRDGFCRMVSKIVNRPKKYGRSIVLLEDDIHMILRVLDYAKYCLPETGTIVLPEMSFIVM